MKFIPGFLLLVLIFTRVDAQPPFHDEIRQFQRQDSIKFPPRNAVLFVGSSSFRLWNDIEASFPRHTIINRGFGGSTLQDVLHYTEQIIFPYFPKQVVIYCGENDVAAGASPHEVLRRFDQLFSSLRKKFTDVPVVFVSIKPSPSRAHLQSQMKQANQLIHTYLKDHKNTVFVDVYSAMLDKNGQPREELFVNDRLHMNAQGYAIWRKAITPHLK
jgi:lysophospholipase L1-like esterase